MGAKSWELQRRPKDGTEKWSYIEDYENPEAARGRLDFKREHGWDRKGNEFRVVRIERIETVEDW